MNALQRVANILHRARVAGGWDDEYVAADILKELGLDENADPRAVEAHTSSEIGHG